MKRIFVGGIGRSGTTIALHALYRHQEIYAIPVETKFLVEEDGFADLLVALTDRFSMAGASAAFGRFEKMMRRQVTGLDDGKFRQQHCFPNDLFANYDAALDAFLNVIRGRRHFSRPEALLNATRLFIAATFDAETVKSGKSVWAEKTPANVWRLPFLCQLWPESYHVLMLRDPRAIMVSLMDRGWLPKELIPALTIFEGYASAMLKVRSEQASNPRFVEVRLENLVEDTPGVLRDLANSLDLVPFDDSDVSGLQEAISNYYLSKPARTLILSGKDRELINEVLLPIVTELGYMPSWDRD